MGAIYWDEMWNVTCGCTPESPGCNNCWAIRMAARHQANPKVRGVYKSDVVADGDWTGKIVLLPHNLEKPLGWRKPRVIFVNGMSDLFHEGVPEKYIHRVLLTIASTPQHTYLILTKRERRMQEILSRIVNGSSGIGQPFQNIWAGASIENQYQADQRIHWLLQTPTPNHWLSVEPMLSGVKIQPTQKASPHSRVGFIACGPENGPGKRPFDPQWAIDLMRQCRQAGTPFFYKGGLLDGKKYLELPWELR